MLALSRDEDVKDFKLSVNADLTDLSVISTGDHLRGNEKPLSTCYADSICLVLRKGRFGRCGSVGVDYYNDKWA